MRIHQITSGYHGDTLLKFVVSNGNQDYGTIMYNNYQEYWTPHPKDHTLIYRN